VLVTRVGNTSIVTRHRINRGDELLVEVDICHVTVARDTLTKLPVPDWMRQGLAAFTATT
jgi:acyl-CoA thioesterase FadM